MKKTFFISAALVILSLASSPLFARGMGGGMGFGGFDGMGYGMGYHKPFLHLEMLQYQLDLTNAQVDKLYKIDKDYLDKFYQNRNNADKIKELRDKHQEEIVSILTPEQKARWNDFNKNRPKKGDRKNFKNRPGFGPGFGMPGFGMNMFGKELSLSDDQIDKIYRLHMDYMDKFYQNRNDGDRVRELRSKQQAEFENILTPEQKAKFNEFKNNPPRNGKRPWKGNNRPGMWGDDADDE